MEPFQLNAPPLMKKKVDLFMFIDSNHAGNQQTRTKNVFMIYVSMPLVNWCSKKQSTIERSITRHSLLT